jgi:hypothetical protein
LEGFDPGWRDDFNNRAFFLAKARPIGEFTDIFPWSTSDSGSPTICQTAS